MAEQAMAEPAASITVPDLPISLGLHPLLAQAAADRRWQDKLRGAVAEQAGALAQTLGIPARPVVQVEVNSALERSPRLLSLSINGRPCRFPDEIITRVYCFLQRVPLSPRPALRELAQEPSERLGDLAALICAEAIKRQPAELLGPEQLAAYLEAINARSVFMSLDAEEASDWLRVFQSIVGLGISIGDGVKVLEELYYGSGPVALRENLISSFAPAVIRIEIPPDYLRTLTQIASSTDRFVLLRDGLFEELGLLLPELTFAPRADLPPNSFAFTLNHLTTLPWIGLSSDEMLVGAPPENLAGLNLADARFALNPARGLPATIIPSAAGSAPAVASLDRWNPFDYLVLCLAADLRENASHFFSSAALEPQLKRLDNSFPALMDAARAYKLFQELPAICRALVDEQVTAAGLKFILERRLDFDYVVEDPTRVRVVDDRVQLAAPPRSDSERARAVTAFIRRGLKPQITQLLAPNGATMAFWRLAPEIENRLLADGAPLSGEEQEQLLDAVRAALAAKPQHTHAPILTSTAARPLVRALLAAEFPQLPVAAFEELTAEAQCEQIGQIPLPSGIHSPS